MDSKALVSFVSMKRKKLRWNWYLKHRMKDTNQSFESVFVSFQVRIRIRSSDINAHPDPDPDNESSPTKDEIFFYISSFS